ncbi:xanthine dehydrogenase accessory factor [Desulfomicrobium norvegicum]|uniref:Xanthine dehydrogenase accessory factor n=1 Tax=Desulfomicrobium norvegicum (strain DSM 1741 / NCIMB 8310) TaxID=52561 RepID=A0A8G2C2I6_DESNO|nr:XdhC/CoxI family protein [Desulfomicrobium norvegicum]SFL66368.1 xanthine dehydrogenase accessory factor [Desulfomicrobium norvegicum]
MNDIFQSVVEVLLKGEDAVFCGIVESSGSAPRTSGARMLVLSDGSIHGSVGGGPVEGACQAKAAKLLQGTKTHHFLSFDLNSVKAADAGMVCGGAVKVLLQRVSAEHLPFFENIVRLQREGERPVLVTVMQPKQDPVLAVWTARDGLAGAALPETLAGELARKAAKTRQSFGLEESGVSVFAEPVVTPTVLHLVGAGHVALATAKVAAFAGFEVVVMDDRSEFADPGRYPEAREVRVLENFDACLADLGADDYVVIVTRGHLHDRDVLAQALKTGAGYIGMIGSRSKRDAVYRSLLESGYTQADLDRVFCPIGLTIGADTPEEIAVSIVGEMIRVRAGVPA